MTEGAKSKRRLLLGFAITAIAVGGLLCFYVSLVKKTPTHKATAFVVGKAQVHITEWDSRFSNKYDNWQTGYEEYRIYFTIDDFPQINGSLRSKLLEQEQKLFGENTRYRIKNKALYEKTKAGDRIIVVYQIIGWGKIDIVGAFLPDEIQE